MPDDLFEIDEIHLGRERPARNSRLARGAFGLLGTVLGLVGALHLLAPPSPIPGLPLRLAAVAMMLAVASFFLFNVLLARTWRWPGLACLAGLPLLFAVRLLFGA